MKPVAILQHSPTEGPGYVATYLDARARPWTLVRVDAGASAPIDPQAYAGLVFMGGPMSVNDPLPWVAAELRLIQRAVAVGVPCLGHCLGGQLMAKALGGVVQRNPVKEIGWGMVQVADHPSARGWFGATREFLSFHWHGETFTIPDGAVRILGSAYCANQAFALGPHLGMQCHVEMTADLIRTWCADWGEDVRRRTSASVQTPEQMAERIDERVRDLNAVAADLYDRWLTGLVG